MNDASRLALCDRRSTNEHYAAGAQHIRRRNEHAEHHRFFGAALLLGAIGACGGPDGEQLTDEVEVQTSAQGLMCSAACLFECNEYTPPITSCFAWCEGQGRCFKQEN